MADTLAVLARLRRLEVARAQKLLAERNAALASAEARHAAAEAAPGTEAARAAPADFAAWLPLALAERERAARGAQHSANLAELARDALTLTRLAQRQVELLRAEKARAEAKRAARRDQAALDDLAGRREPC